MTDFLDTLREVLGAQYRIERELGGGGMSRVFVATETSLGREVVVKVVAPGMMAEVEAERFAREVKLAARLQHTNIVPVLTAGEAGGTAYYTMPFVRGESLHARLQRGTVPASDARAILRDIARALAYAHDQGVVHRDIKPGNVLLSGDAAMVADFGIAKAIAASQTEAAGGTLTPAGASLGTPAYMAPEQALGDEVDGRADLYAWGVMAYELLAGQHPFHDRKTAQQLIAAQISERPTPLLDQLPTGRRRNAGDRALAALVMRCLEKPPAARPQSARTLLAAFDGPDSSRPSTRPRSVTIGLAAVTLCLLGGGGYVLSRRAGVVTRLEPKRVVVATFENKTGDASLDPLGAMAADWIARGLVSTGLVDVGGTAADLAARDVAVAARAGDSPLETLARNANAGIVVSGAFYRVGDSVLFQADFTDANVKKLVQTVGPVSALATAPLVGVEQLRQRVIGALAPIVDSTLATYASSIGQPPSLEAYREFLSGEDLFYRDEAASVLHYARAAAADTNYTLPLLRAMAVFTNSGDGERYDSLAPVLEQRRGRLTPFERAYMDYVTCGSSPQRQTCAPATAEMVRLTPKSQFAAYLHGIMLRWTNRQRSADSVFRRLDPKSGELRGRIYFVRHHAGVLHALGEHHRELSIARDGRAQYPARLFLAYSEIGALVALGQLNEVERAVDEMLTLAPDQRSSAALSGALTVYDLRWHRHPSAADTLGRKLLAWLDARPTPNGGTAASRRDRAAVLTATHHWRELESIADTLVSEDPGNVLALRHRGVALAMQGRRADAEAVDQALERDRRPIRPADGCPSALHTCRSMARAFIAAALGDKARAVSLLDYANFNDQFAHFELIGELLRDYRPFLDFIAPRS
jgi:aminoglycoside phosphotransferase (APT) family kinase protein